MWTLVWGWSLGLAGPADTAVDALVDGRDRAALQALRSAVRTDDDPDSALRCLLGEVALQVGRAQEALEVLDEVPEDAPCHGRAAFVQAEALRATGQLDLAAQRYGDLTEALVSPGGASLAVRIEAWADRLLEEETPDRSTAVVLLHAAAELDEGRRLALARRIAALSPDGAPLELAVRELSAAITAAPEGSASDRRLLAGLVDADFGRQLLADLPDDPETMAARVGVAARRGLAARHQVASALLAAHSDAPITREVRLEVGRALADAGWIAEAQDFLEPLAAGEGDEAEEAAWSLAELALRAGDSGAEALLQRFLDRFPTSIHRSTAEERLASLSLEGLRRAGTEGFDGEAWDRRIDGPTLALEAAWTAPDPERIRRLDELVARWPWSPEAAEALRYRALEEGLDWLRERSGQGAADQVMAELLEPEIGIRTPDEAGAATVELLVRGMDEVELRLHRVDVEGWLRAGGTPGSLGELDVAIVAPDARWTVDVPDGGPEVRFDVPVPVPGPGLYAVTAATTDREARTLLLVSDVELLARAQGEDLALVALRDGEPEPRARFWVRDGDGVKQVTADGQGLATTTIASAPVVVVGQTPRGPAILEVGQPFQTASDPVRTAVDLDRPGYRPGDVVRFRALATRAGEPLRGKWRVSLMGPGGMVHQVVRTTADRNGTIEGEVVLPWVSTQRLPDGAGTTTMALIALPPGQDNEVHLADVVMVEDAPAAVRLVPSTGPDGLVVRVEDGLGVPVPEHPVELVIDDGPREVLRADASGRLQVAAPPAGVPWTVVMQVPEHPASRRTHRRASAPAPKQRLWVDDPRAAPGEVVPVGVDGEGEALLRVVRLESGAEPVRVKVGSDPFEVPSLQVYTASVDRVASGATVRRTVSEQSISLDDGTLQLPGLDAGRYVLELVRPDGSAPTLTTELEVREGTRVRLDEAAVVGREAEVSVDGGWALVTAEGGRMLGAHLVPPGRSRTFPVDRRWHGSVSFVATAVGDRHERQVSIDAALQVELEAAQRQGRWAVTGQVTDAAGNPVSARVVVRALDRELIDELGHPSTVELSLLGSRVAWGATGAVAGALRHGGWSEMLSAALLDEAARVAEKKRASLAAEGRLAESRVAKVLDTEVPLEVGGLGMSGSGYGGGGGGFGSKGHGVTGVARGGATRLGAQGQTLRGHREVGLWTVVDTDRDGRFSVDAEAPQARAHWTIDAVAVAPGTLGTAQVDVDTTDRPWLALDPLQPGWAGDVAKPRVHVVNPSGEEVELELISEAGGRGTTIGTWTLPPSGVVRVELGSWGAGTSRTLRLQSEGQVLDTQTLSFDLAAGPVVDDGPVRVSVPGHVDGTVVGTLALLDEPMALDDPARAIVAGREALAGLPALTSQERQRSLVRIWGAVGVARARASSLDVRGGAQALLLVAEAADELELPRSVVEAVAGAVGGEPETPQERLELAYARAVAEVPVLEATVGRLLRDAERLDPEGRALLARLLARLGSRSQVDGDLGDGPQAVLATREGRGPRLDPRGVLTQPPPPRGDPARADWIRVLVLALGDTPGTASGSGLVRGTTSVPSAPLSWTEGLPEGDHEVAAARWPASLSGRPARVAVASSPWSDTVRCGSEEDPCRIAVGEALQLDARDGWLPSGGLRWSVRRDLLVATTPGQYVLRGLPGREGPGRGLVVEIGEGLSPLGPGETLALAHRRLLVGEDVADLLADRPSLEDWSSGLRSTAARVRFEAADPEDAAGWIAAFEDLRDEVPTAPLEADDVVRTAAAYHRLGQPERAIAVYERAIGQAFLTEAAVAQRMGGVVGELASLQALRDLTLRYPAVPLVEQASFALPDRLLSMVGALSENARAQGITDTELRLMAAAWDRRFVALAPDSELTPEAGLRLATLLVELGAEERALAWVERLQRTHPDHELVDRWMLLEALVRTELGRTDRARSVLERLAEDELPLGGGRLGPSLLRDDARLSLGRLAEAERRWDEAADWYRGVRGTFPEAGLSVTALERVVLEADEPLVVHPVGSGSRVTVRAANVDAVHVRAYAVDLRTLFLREGGLPMPETVQVDGLRPSFSGVRSVQAGPFPVTRTVDVPLQGPGAWLVRLDSDGAQTVVWMLKSDLEIDATDQDGLRRLSVRRKTVPEDGAEIRAVGYAGIEATETDIRGVATVGAGAPALAQAGPHAAFTRDAVPSWGATPSAPAYGPAAPSPSLRDRVRGREEQRRQKRRSQYDFIGEEPASAIEASQL